jgi:multidrug transporter EmrE-like cation transporter
MHMTTTIRDWALFAAVSVTLAAGNLLLAGAVRAAGGASLRLIFTPRVLVAIVIYLGSFLLYLHVLASMDVSKSYPIIVGAAFALVLIGAWALLGESVTAWRVIGCVLICCGIALGSRS